MSNNMKYRKSEKGNVLFLILIAVALFAALSYVVTQSTRSGGGSTEREQNILSSAQMTQYPTALRTALIRMILAGTAIENVAFNSGGNFFSIRPEAAYVFSPRGGAAIYQDAPADLLANGTAAPWVFNANNEVPGIGLDGAGGNDVIAFLPGVSSGVCRQVNEELGINTAGCTAMQSNVPTVAAANLVNSMVNTSGATHVFPTTDQVDILGAGCTTGFARQASGCFYDTASTRFVFYSVLLER